MGGRGERGVAEAKSRWVGLLADLQDQLGEVEDVWLDRLQLVRLPPPGPEVEQADAKSSRKGSA